MPFVPFRAGLTWSLVISGGVLVGPHRPILPPDPTPFMEIVMNSLTPVILVDEVEPCLAFWVERLGFDVTAQVPEGDRIGFAILKRGGVEIMYQSRASVEGDVPALASGPFERSGIGLFIRVDDLDPILPHLHDQEVVVPERRTFYGAREIGIRTACGTLVTFAAFDTND